jgi:hypothetical protein
MHGMDCKCRNVKKGQRFKLEFLKDSRCAETLVEATKKPWQRFLAPKPTTENRGQNHF